MKVNLLPFFLTCSVVVSSSCKKDYFGNALYTVPDTYAYDNVDFKESSASVKMMSSVNSYIGTTQTNMNKVTLDQTKINNLWNNTNNPFDTLWLNGTGISLSAKSADPAIFKGLMDALVTLSAQNLTPAANGTEGYIVRNSGKILVNAKGLEYVQGIQKGLMSAVLFKEAMVLLDKVPTADNNTVVPGKGTQMAHNFDLAFGYLSIPLNYDTAAAFSAANRSAMPYWGGYLYERGRYIEAGYNLFKAFRTGRAAIVAKDIKKVKEQVNIIKLYWEKLAAAAAWDYSALPQSQSGNLAAQLHNLSEGAGFVAALKYRSASSPLTAAKYQELVAMFSIDANFYDLLNDANYAKLKAVKEILRSAYGNLQAQ